MDKDKIDKYSENFEEGSESTKKTGWGDQVQKHIDVGMGRHDGKTEEDWTAYNDGKAGNWNPSGSEEDE